MNRFGKALANLMKEGPIKKNSVENKQTESSINMQIHISKHSKISSKKTSKPIMQVAYNNAIKDRYAEKLMVLEQQRSAVVRAHSPDCKGHAPNPIAEMIENLKKKKQFMKQQTAESPA